MVKLICIIFLIYQHTEMQKQYKEFNIKLNKINKERVA